MKKGDIISGFRLVRINGVGEMNADIYEFEHEKTGARLAYLAREDDNMSFAISFATPPADDTGVCHIIEHSVLCGSKKYPLRDPFAELLKGSLNTFLNAMTYEDKTVYPVSSRCEKDFLNLVDVYLDAVLRPALLENPSIFHQEGWHYEYDGERLTRSGVVYNEMKGAYSSPDDIAVQELSRSLFKDTVYECDSGGDPDAIPTLTYEGLVSFYKKYYHPSNAKIFLDGTLDVERVLALIDSHISGYERRDINVTYGLSAPTVTERTVSYEISEGDEDERARVLLGYVYSEHDDATEHLKTLVLSEYLCGSNASVLKHELLSRGLCHDVMMYTNKTREQTVVIEVRDTSEEKIPEIKRTIESTIRKICSEGLDKNDLRATLDLIEFKLRERDYGSLPRGIGFALSALGVWLYGTPPEEALVYEESLMRAREDVECGGFERTLLEMTVDNPHRSVLTMLPDSTLAERRAEREETELSEILSKMTDADIEKIKSDEQALEKWQNEEESPEALATLPTLLISDIPSKRERTPREVIEQKNCRAILHDINTEGITYANLFFDISDVPAEKLYLVSIMAAALSNLDTKESTALSLRSKIKASLGSFSISVATSAKGGVAKPYIRVITSALDTKKENLVSLIQEILLTSDFNNREELENIVAQSKSAYEDAVLSSGHSVALDRLEAYTSPRGAISEHLSGYEAYTKLKELFLNKSKIPALIEELSELSERIFTRKRLTLSLAGARDTTLSESIISLFPEGEGVSSIKIEPLGNRREFILAPVKVAYATLGSCESIDARTLGAMRVARSILSYEYLWQNVRVSGGAYGAGFVPRRTGFLGFYSYRDPSPARSLGVFKKSSDYLRTVANSETDLTKFIIGAYGEYDILTTPRTAAALSSWNYICGITDEELELELEAILRADKNALLNIADLIDRAASEDAVCIVGGKEHLKSCEDKAPNVLHL